MQLTLSLNIPPLPRPLRYTDRLLLIGSCFTEHISERLARHKFRVMDNPHGILFNPLSVAHSLDSYITAREYTAADLFLLNELYNSWDHHTRFSDTSQAAALQRINDTQRQAAAFLRQADWVMITLGSAFQYYLKEGGRPVANNHRAPAQWFEKKLLSVDEITGRLAESLERLQQVNEGAQVLFTISPVRHIRDGVVDNNRSKARLIEAVHELCSRYEHIHYFPAYELVIDILRDYRFYDLDFVHPNYLATSFVWDEFVKSCIAPDARPLMKEVNDIMTARSHKTRFPDTEAHKSFKQNYSRKVQQLLQQYPFLDLGEEAQYFGT